MWKWLLISAALALITSSAAHSLLLFRNANPALAPFNITSPALEAPGKTILTYPPWPTWPTPPYSIILRGPGLGFLNMYLLMVDAKNFQSSPMISVAELRHFMQDFADNIQPEHPVPSFVPRYVTQLTVDISSYRKWTVKTNGFRGRLPTAAALVPCMSWGSCWDGMGHLKSFGLSAR